MHFTIIKEDKNTFWAFFTDTDDPRRDCTTTHPRKKRKKRARAPNEPLNVRKNYPKSTRFCDDDISYNDSSFLVTTYNKYT